jgi:lactate dehydrogenase-like 2-hydroxyacid dehydrogenase
LALNKVVKYVQVPYEGAKKSFMEGGYPEWQVDGILELSKLIDSENKVMNHEGQDFKKITGRNPTTIQEWVGQVANVFGRDKKIGILGTADVGKALAAGFVKHGYDVMIGSREGKSERLTTLATEIKGLKTGTF